MQRNKYSNQIHISFLEDKSSGPHIADRISKKHQETLQCIDLDISLREAGSKLSSLSSLDNKGRLYINGHGSFDSPNEITNNNGEKLNYQKFAKLLAQHLTHPSLKDKNSKPRLKISLVMCESSTFGEKLHAELSKYGIYCDVVARTRDIATASASIHRGRKKTYSHNVDKETYAAINQARFSNKEKDRAWAASQDKQYMVHQQPGSKVVFCWDEQNKQILKHAYDGLFKRKAIMIIDQQLNNRPAEEQKALITLNNEIAKLEQDELIKEALEESELLKKLDKNDELSRSISGLISYYETGKDQLSHAADNIKMVVNSEVPLYRMFQAENYPAETLIEKKMIDGIIHCRDSKSHPPERFAGLNKLLFDISKQSSLEEKLKVFHEALEVKSDPYKLNKFEEGKQFTLSFSPTLTRAYTELKDAYASCNKDYHALKQARPTSLKG